jgi:hypothetical protein
LLRFRFGKSLIAAGAAPEAAPLFADEAAIPGNLHPGWIALQGRFLRAQGKPSEAMLAFEHARSLAPYLVEAACEGQTQADVPAETPPPLFGAEGAALCEAARKIPSD